MIQNDVIDSSCIELDSEVVEQQNNDESLEVQLMKAEDQREINNIVQLFNANMQKKNIIRSNKMSDLQDKIIDQVQQRIDKHAGEFSNKDLLDYMNSIQSMISKQGLDQTVEAPTIQLKQVNVNIGEQLDQQSRDRIKDAIAAILKQQEIDNRQESNNNE